MGHISGAVLALFRRRSGGVLSDSQTRKLDQIGFYIT
jgi:hypothetical protein